MRRIAAAALLGLAMIAVAAPAEAATAADDPRCAPLRTQLESGVSATDVISVDEGATIDSRVPAELRSSATCAWSIPTILGQYYGLAFFDDPRQAFLDSLDVLGSDWRVTDVIPTGPTTLAEIAALPADGSIDVQLTRGSIGSRSLEEVSIAFRPDGSTDFGDDITATAPYTAVYYNPPPSLVEIDDPSTLSNLRSVADAVPNPIQTVVALVAAALMTLAVGFPGALLGGVLVARQDELTRRIAPLAGVARRFSGVARRRWAPWVALVVASLIASFVDPNAGINPLTGRLLLTFVAAFTLFNVGGYLLVTRVVRRLEPEAASSLEFRFGALVLIAVTVVVSRLAGFDPGVVMGMVSGVVFATALVLTRQVLVVLVGAGAAAAVAIVAWIGYSVLTGVVGDTDSVGVIVAQEVLAAITIQGVSTLPIALLPFARLDGAVLFRWQKAVWGFVYVIGTMLFMFVMFSVPGGAQPPGDFGRWFLVYLIFAAVAVGVWAIDRALVRRAARTETDVTLR